METKNKNQVLQALKVEFDAIQITVHKVMNGKTVIGEYGSMNDIPISQYHLVNQGVYQVVTEEEFLF